MSSGTPTCKHFRWDPTFASHVAGTALKLEYDEDLVTLLERVAQLKGPLWSIICEAANTEIQEDATDRKLMDDAAQKHTCAAPDWAGYTITHSFAWNVSPYIVRVNDYDEKEVCLEGKWTFTAEATAEATTKCSHKSHSRTYRVFVPRVVGDEHDPPGGPQGGSWISFPGSDTNIASEYPEYDSALAGTGPGKRVRFLLKEGVPSTEPNSTNGVGIVQSSRASRPSVVSQDPSSEGPHKGSSEVPSEGSSGGSSAASSGVPSI